MYCYNSNTCEIYISNACRIIIKKYLFAFFSIITLVYLIISMLAAINSLRYLCDIITEVYECVVNEVDECVSMSAVQMFWRYSECWFV